MDFGRLAIARAIADKDLTAVLERGLTPEMMPTSEDAQVLDFVLEFYRQHRDVPSPQVVETTFPDYKLGYAADPTSFYVDEVVRQHVRSKAQESVLRNAKGLVGSADPFGVLGALKGHLSRLASLGTVSLERDVSEGALDRLQLYEDRKNNVGLLGIPTPWSSLDNWTQGWQAESYYGIAARPKTGKTWLLLRIAHKAWAEGYNVLFFNKENRTEIMERRLDALEYMLPYQKLRKGLLTSAQEKRYESGLKKMDQSPPKNFFRFIHGANTVSEVHGKVDEHKPDIIVVDGAYLLIPETGGSKEWERQKSLSREIKALATATKLPTLITIQLNRGADMKQRSTRNGVMPITLGDVAGSDAFAQDVDMLIGMEQTDDMRAQDQMKLIPLATREADAEPVMIGWDFDTMESKDFGSIASMFGGIDAQEEEILEIED